MDAFGWMWDVTDPSALALGTSVLCGTLGFFALAWLAKWRTRADESEDTFQAIEDEFSSIADLREELEHLDFQANLIIGIDFSKSNEYTGAYTNNATCLHAISPDKLNPYQEVLRLVGLSLAILDEDQLFPAFGFGSQECLDFGVFPLATVVLSSFDEVIECYAAVARRVQLGGPTSVAPLIERAIDIVEELQSYHILVLLTDGQIVREEETRAAVVRASKSPLSIIAIGVGDGPFGVMEEFDDGLPKRKFDNFQFVAFNEVLADVRKSYDKRFGTGEVDAEEYENMLVDSFALAAMMELPAQYKLCKELLKDGYVQEKKLLWNNKEVGEASYLSLPTI